MGKKLKILKDKWGKLIIIGICFGVITHGMILFNDLPNGDGLIFNYYTFQRTVILGRWLLGIACLVSGPFTIPVVNGIISIILAVMSAILIIDLFEVNQKVNQIIIVGIMVSFPSLASGFLYMFTMDGYMISVFLSVFSIWILHNAKKKMLGYVGSIVCIACSMGIYQAYLSITMTICIFNIIFLILKDNKKIIRTIAEYLVCGMLGVILYFVILKIVLILSGLKLEAYQGIENAGAPLSLGQLLIRIKIIYAQSIITIGTKIFINKLFVLLFIAQWIIIIYFMVRKVNVFKLLKIIACFGVLPICLLPIYLTSTDVSYYLLMKYSWALIFIYVIVMMEYFNLSKITNRIIIIFSCIIIYGFILGNNSMYEYASLRHDRTLMLLNRIESCLESGKYDTSKKIGIFYEGIEDEKYQCVTNVYPYAQRKYIDVRDYNAEEAMKLFFTSKFSYMGEQQCKDYENTKEYQSMKLDNRSFRIFETQRYIIIKVNAGIEKEETLY